MIIVSGIMTVGPSSHDRLVELARTVSTGSLKEPGCRAYGLWADPDVRGRFRIFEEWESQEALTEHFGTPHFAAFGSGLGELELDRHGRSPLHRSRGGGPVLTAPTVVVPTTVEVITATAGAMAELISTSVPACGVDLKDDPRRHIDWNRLLDRRT